LSKSSSKSFLKRRSTWIASMLACFAFLLMAVEVYNVPISLMISNLMSMLIGLGLIVSFSGAIGWLMAVLRKRRK
jgi:ABC-type Co2+ transport system permease subunit